MKRPSKQKCIELIIEEIDKGRTYTDSLAYFGAKWGKLPESTFTNYWNEAKKAYEKQQEAIKKEVLKDCINEEKEANREHLYDKGIRAEELISDIAGMRSEIIELRKVSIIGKKLDGTSEIIITTQSDVTNAKRAIASLQSSINQSLELLAKWYGYNEPEKQDVTLRGSVDIEKWLVDNGDPS